MNNIYLYDLFNDAFQPRLVICFEQEIQKLS